MKKEDLPINYIALTDYLDMIGVKLAANYQKTRQINCDELLLKVKNMIRAWKGGKFMPITERSTQSILIVLAKSGLNVQVYPSDLETFLQ